MTGRDGTVSSRSRDRVRRSRDPGRASQRGAATVIALMMLALLLTMTLLAAGITGVVTAHRRAEAAADLAALAGAAAWQRARDPCAAAGAVARANGAALGACTTGAAGDVTVEVSVVAAGRLALLGRFEARARAGSADGSGGLLPMGP